MGGYSACIHGLYHGNNSLLLHESSKGWLGMWSGVETIHSVLYALCCKSCSDLLLTLIVILIL